MKFISRALIFLAVGILPACAQITKFKHIIVVIQENRTPDNLFYGLCSPPFGTAASCSTSPSATQYDIKTKDWLDKKSSTGVTQPVPQSLSAPYGTTHQHVSFVQMCDAPAGSTTCKMDGAADIVCTGTCPAHPQFAYADNSTGLINPYLTMATQYGWANYMFQTNQGPSFPAHLFLFGGTSAPSSADDAAGIFDAENNNISNVTEGCIAPADTKVQLITPQGEVKGNMVYPCFEHQTVADLLTGWTWRYYAPDITGSSSLWSAPNAIQHICQSTGPGGKCAGTEFTNNVNTNKAGVLNDIAACNLANVSWVIPNGNYSDHATPDGNDSGGPSWVASIVNAVGGSAACDSGDGYWKDTAVLVVWDDWGGWYDHVAPTILPGVQGDYQHGFRVPFLFISAYTSAHYINNNRLDFGSIIRFIQHNFNITEGALGFADARATTDLTAFYKLNTAPRTFTPIAAPKNAAFFLNDTRPATAPDDDDDDK
jgi:phospholipase C